MSDDLDDLMAQLGAAQVSGRTPMDSYREFRQVFLGSDMGKRVLYDILDWARIWKPVAARGDPHETYRRDGERNMGLRILTTIHVEPRERPQRQQTREED